MGNIQENDLRGLHFQ